MIVVKVSLVLTFGSLTAALFVSSGCAQRLAEPGQQAVQNYPVALPEIIPPTNSVSESSHLPLGITNNPPATVAVKEAPPLPQVEVIGVPPDLGYTWDPGRWKWDNGWSWSSGKWVALPEPNAAWTPGRWVRRDHGWVWVQGYWRTAALK
jgi:hypothetical protein